MHFGIPAGRRQNIAIHKNSGREAGNKYTAPNMQPTNA